MAYFARHIYVRQKVHFNANDTVTATSFATTAFNIEAETPRLIAANLSFRRLTEKLTNKVENPRIRSRIRPRSPPDRSLIYINNFIDIFRSLNGFKLPRTMRRPVNRLCHSLVEDFIDQSRFTGTADTGYNRKRAYGNSYIYIP